MSAVQLKSAIKYFSSLVRIVHFELAHGMPEEEIYDFSKAVRRKATSEANNLITLLDIPPSDAQWATEFYSQVVLGKMTDLWPENRTECFKMKFSEYLAGLAQEYVYEPLPRVWRESSHEASFIATAISGLDLVMREYRHFDMFHKDEAFIQKTATDTVSKASHKALEALTDFLPDQTQATKQAIYQSIYKSCCQAFADEWRRESTLFATAYNSVSPEQRILLAQQKGDVAKIINYVNNYAEVIATNVKNAYSSALYKPTLVNDQQDSTDHEQDDDQHQPMEMTN